jgi:hypothetical protein
MRLGTDAQSIYNDANKFPDKAGYLEKKGLFQFCLFSVLTWIFFFLGCLGAKVKSINKRWFVLKDNWLFYAKVKITSFFY